MDPRRIPIPLWGCSEGQGLGLHPAQGWLWDGGHQRGGKKRTKPKQSSFSWFFLELQHLDSLLPGWEQGILQDAGRIDGQDHTGQNPIPQGWCGGKATTFLLLFPLALERLAKQNCPARTAPNPAFPQNLTVPSSKKINGSWDHPAALPSSQDLDFRDMGCPSCPNLASWAAPGWRAPVPQPAGRRWGVGEQEYFPAGPRAAWGWCKSDHSQG